jgi:hypothetical protein
MDFFLAICQALGIALAVGALAGAVAPGDGRAPPKPRHPPPVRPTSTRVASRSVPLAAIVPAARMTLPLATADAAAFCPLFV